MQKNLLTAQAVARKCHSSYSLTKVPLLPARFSPELSKTTIGEQLSDDARSARDLYSNLSTSVTVPIARYYTPSGRCIQRPYESGKDRNYELDLYNRYEHGEFFSRDSIKQNEKERYNTSLGRTVYGGGGIMPDIFVPQDTTGVTSYLSTVIGRGLTIQFTFQYTDNNRKKLSEYETEELLNYLRRQGLVEQFVRFADSKGVKRRNILIQKSYKLLEKNIYGNIIYNMLGLEAYLQYFNKSDATVNKGIEILEKGEAFPKAPIAVEEEEATNKDGKKKGTA